ncbi:MAG TPA: hypothetical protein VF958_03130 [Thermoanaerobaculia bacterium]
MMNKFAIAAVAVAILTSAAACQNDNNDVAGSRGSLAVLNVDAPSFAQSGVEFGVEISATSVGVSNVLDGHVVITFEAPLIPRSLDASAGTSASISSSSVTWDLGTLDSNTRSRLQVRTIATLASGEASRSARIRAELTARGITSGEAVATDFVTVTP